MTVLPSSSLQAGAPHATPFAGRAAATSVRIAWLADQSSERQLAPVAR